MSTWEPGRPEVLPGCRDSAIWLPGIPRSSQGLVGTWVFTEPVFPWEMEPAPPSLYFASFAPDAGFSSWCCPPYRGRCSNSLLSTGPDDHPSCCRALPGGHPARNAPLSPCVHARHTHVCTHHTLIQVVQHTQARGTPASSRSSSRSSHHLLAHPSHLTFFFLIIFGHAASPWPPTGSSLRCSSCWGAQALKCGLNRSGTQAWWLHGCEICPAPGLSPRPRARQADS